MKDYRVPRKYHFAVTYARNYFLAVMSVKNHVIMVIVNLALYVHALNVVAEAQNMNVYAPKLLARQVNNLFAIKFVGAIEIVEDINVLLNVVRLRINISRLKNGSLHKTMTMRITNVL